MKNNTPAIIAVAYNRPQSLARLLRSINNAIYSGTDIPLIISIDYAENNEEVLMTAKKFKWDFGSKEVIYHKKNLGLRKHVIKCGDLSETYGSIIMLEDDLIVSPNFYTYAVAALNYSEGKSHLAGISLYNHRLNVHTNEIFSPIQDGYDNYFFQFASSWGQAWSMLHWNQFKLWYVKNPKLIPKSNIPKQITDWSDKSWLKFFTAYLIDKNLYFLYPKVSLTTNFTEAGTHFDLDSTGFQVPLSFAKNYTIKFSTIENSQSIYDAFYENIQLYKTLGLQKKELTIDLYGYKPQSNKRYWITSQIKSFKILETFGMSLKPIDANIILNIKGDDIYLYDTSQQESNDNKAKRYRRIFYSIGQLSIKNSLIVSSELLALKIKGKFGIK